MSYIPDIKTTTKGYFPVKEGFLSETYVAFGGTEYTHDCSLLNYKLYNDDYKVVIDGKEYKARNCRVSKIPFNRPWPGHQRDFSQSEDAAFISVYGEAPLTLTVSLKGGFSAPLVRPLSKNVPFEKSGDDVVITLEKHGKYVLEPESEHNALHIFFEEAKEYPDAKDATYYYGPGIHFPGVIKLKDNDSVYIDKEAIVFGSLYSEGGKNIRVFGGGTIDNTTEERICENCYENYTKGTLRFYDCKDIKIEDIILVNSSIWVLALFDCDNAVIDNIKIVGHWRYNADGIDITNTSNVLIKNSFIRSFDDTITIKAIYEHPSVVENIVVDNCVLWCDWGNNCEVGIETDAPVYRNIVFKNSDLVHNAATAMDIQNGCGADISNVTFENLNIEYSKYALPMVFQQSEEQVYAADNMGVPNLIAIVNHKMPLRKRTPEGVIRATKDFFGYTHDILFKNINVYMDELERKPSVILKSYDENVVFKNIVIDSLYINGAKQENLDDFKLVVENAEYELK